MPSNDCEGHHAQDSHTRAASTISNWTKSRLPPGMADSRLYCGNHERLPPGCMKPVRIIVRGLGRLLIGCAGRANAEDPARGRGCVAAMIADKMLA